jgi:hypothetical protein
MQTVKEPHLENMCTPLQYTFPALFITVYLKYVNSNTISKALLAIVL